MEGAYVYLLECRDASLYCGSTRQEMETRLSEHQNGHFKDSYTHKRRPVTLLWCEHFPNITDAIACERQIKGWSRAKKLAMIDQNWAEVSRLSQNAERRDLSPSTLTLRQAQGEVEGVGARQETVTSPVDLTLSPEPVEGPKGRGRTHKASA
jgi:putative endonuclease